MWGLLPAVRTSALFDIKFDSSVRKNKQMHHTFIHVSLHRPLSFAQASFMHAYKQREQ